MKIRRPGDYLHSAAAVRAFFISFVIAAICIRKLAFPRRWLRWFYRAGPYAYSSSFEMKIAGARQVMPGLETVANCIRSAREAADAGFASESAALSITAAKLAFKAYSFERTWGTAGLSIDELKGILLGAFHDLRYVVKLPPDDADYWADRLSEIVAALFPEVAAFDYAGEEQSEAAASMRPVAQVVSRLAPWRDGASLEPLSVAHLYPGGIGRLHASLALLQLLGGDSGGALSRLTSLLQTTFNDPGDRIYAQMVGLVAARREGKWLVHGHWLDALHATIDRDREQYRSFEGRLYALETASAQFAYAFQTWATDKKYDPDDLFSIVEGLKARVLLDELEGLGASRDLANPLQARVKVGVALEDPEREPDFEFSELPRDVVSELGRISYWSVAPGSGMSSDAPEGTLSSLIHKSNLMEMRSLDAARAAAYGSYAESARSASAETVRQALHDDELLVDFFIPRRSFLLNRMCWIIAVQRSGSSYRCAYLDAPGCIIAQQHDDHFIERGPLAERVAATRVAILAEKDHLADEHLRQWFDLLIQPIIDMGLAPERFRRWILVPHGPLHLIPLHAALDSAGRRLIERVSVTTAPSASVWLRMRNDHSDGVAQMLAVGNPTSTRGGPPLPDAEQEVAELAALPWPGMQIKVLTRADASEKRVKQELRDFNMIHFAAHGQIDAADVRDGHRILLAGADGEDGSLSAGDVRHMDMRKIRLAVLNTCNGAFCRYGPGDEPLGLLSAFIAAGVANVIGALWPLDDEMARRFILWFYQGLAKGDPADALRHASARAIGEAWPLRHWCGLIVVGTSRPLGLHVSAATSMPML